MIVCHNNYPLNSYFSLTTVKFEESDFNDPLFGVGFTFTHLIVPLYLKGRFLKSKVYQYISPVISSIEGGIIEYIDFNGEYREKQLRVLFD